MLYAATWLSSGSCSGLVLAGLIACHLPGLATTLESAESSGSAECPRAAVGRLTILRAAFRRLSSQDAPRLKSSPPYCLH